MLRRGDNVGKIFYCGASTVELLLKRSPDIGGFDAELVAESMVAVCERVGDNVLITHSAGGD